MLTEAEQLKVLAAFYSLKVHMQSTIPSTIHWLTVLLSPSVLWRFLCVVSVVQSIEFEKVLHSK